MARDITVTFTAERVSDDESARRYVETLASATRDYGYDVSNLTFVSSRAPEVRVNVTFTQSEYDAFVAWRDSSK